MNYLKMKPLFDGSSEDCTTSSLQTVTKTFIYKANKIGSSAFVSEEFYFTMKVNARAENSHKLAILQLNIQQNLKYQHQYQTL